MNERIHKLVQMQADLLDPGTLDEKLKMITGGVVDIFDADFSRIWLVRPGDRCDSGCAHAAATEGPHVCRHRDKCLHLTASSGRYTHTDGGLHARVPFGCYKIGGIASGEYKSFLTNDVTNDPRVHNHDWAKEFSLVSFAGFQLRPPHGETIGVLALFSRNVISQEEYDLLEIVASTAVRVVKMSEEEAALRQATRFNTEILDSSADGIVVYSRDLRYLLWNKAMEKMTGFAASQVLGKKTFEVFPNLAKYGVDLLFKRALHGEVVTSRDIPTGCPRRGGEAGFRISTARIMTRTEILSASWSS